MHRHSQVEAHPFSHWTSAMLLRAISGIIGEAVVLSNLSIFMPKLHAAAGGKYGAFPFATYALVLGAAEVITLKSSTLAPGRLVGRRFLIDS